MRRQHDKPHFEKKNESNEEDKIRFMQQNKKINKILNKFHKSANDDEDENWSGINIKLKSKSMNIIEDKKNKEPVKERVEINDEVVLKKKGIDHRNRERGEKKSRQEVIKREQHIEDLRKEEQEMSNKETTHALTGSLQARDDSTIFTDYDNHVHGINKQKGEERREKKREDEEERREKEGREKAMVEIARLNKKIQELSEAAKIWNIEANHGEMNKGYRREIDRNTTAGHDFVKAPQIIVRADVYKTLENSNMISEDKNEDLRKEIERYYSTQIKQTKLQEDLNKITLIETTMEKNERKRESLKKEAVRQTKDIILKKENRVNHGERVKDQQRKRVHEGERARTTEKRVTRNRDPDLHYYERKHYFREKNNREDIKPEKKNTTNFFVINFFFIIFVLILLEI